MLVYITTLCGVSEYETEVYKYTLFYICVSYFIKGMVLHQGCAIIMIMSYCDKSVNDNWDKAIVITEKLWILMYYKNFLV